MFQNEKRVLKGKSISRRHFSIIFGRRLGWGSFNDDGYIQTVVSYFPLLKRLKAES